MLLGFVYQSLSNLMNIYTACYKVYSTYERTRTIFTVVWKEKTVLKQGYKKLE